jgi:hypothetical protein
MKMFESRSKVTQLKSAIASKICQKSRKESVDVVSRYPITEAVIRVLDCKLSDEPVTETYADLIALALCRKAIKDAGVREFREIRSVVEGPRAQAIYNSWSVMETPDESERRPASVLNSDDPGQRSSSVA